MKTIDIPISSSEISNLLAQARGDDCLVRLSDGSEFLLIAVDDFDREIAAGRSNPRLMALLDARAEQTKTVALSDVRQRLGIH